MEKPMKKEIYLLPINRTLRDLLIEITNLDNEFGCVASNKFLAESLRIKVDTVSKYISKLKELGYIQQEKFNGRVRTLRSLFSSKTGNSSYPAYEKKVMQPPNKKSVTDRNYRKFSESPAEKTAWHSTSKYTNNSVISHSKNTQDYFSVQWNKFLNWAKNNLTPDSCQKINAIKLSYTGNSVNLFGINSEFLKQIILSYFSDKCSDKFQILFDSQNEINSNQTNIVSMQSLKINRLVINKSDIQAM